MTVLVVGAGPAGMMAAIEAADAGNDVSILDSNGRGGVKLNITGKGRCNLTNDCDTETFLRNVVRNGVFLRSAIASFPPQLLIQTLAQWGVDTKVERGNRVFPVSDKAKDITCALEHELQQRNIPIRKAKVTALLFQSGQVIGACAGAKRFPADHTILATGGRSYPQTGSDGSGYFLAQQAGHTVFPAEASLVGLVVPNVSQLRGLTLVNVSLTLQSEKNAIRYSDGPGELLFTGTGISGPLVLSASAHYAEGDRVVLDLKPGMTEQVLDARLLREIAAAPLKSLHSILKTLEPDSLILPLCQLAGLDATKRSCDLTKTERQALLRTLKQFSLFPSRKESIENAIITRGGVKVEEIVPKTMKSRVCNGLSICGELLDVDAYTGGFNLQIAFSTGRAAGKGVSQ
jgi:predicted Rossmann fold flavoprotein